MEIRHIPGKRNPTDTLSRRDIKDALGRKTVVHDANTDLVRELRVPSDANDTTIQEALIKLFSAQVRDQSESVAVEGQASRAKISAENQALKAQSSDSDQALKAQSSDSDQVLKAQSSVQFSLDQPKSKSKSPSSVQFKTSVSVSSSSPSSSHCTLAVSRNSINIDNSLREKIYSLLQKEILYKEILEEMESTGENELIRG